ncbi:MAG: hypothetical protein JSS69_02080 [Acidobacteria bacterium]|nr:hypothetical protein [Acidobacteriota bacterium]MBS1864682.1 hypothetical protein [Acidobacteriota bacterium]
MGAAHESRRGTPRSHWMKIAFWEEGRSSSDDSANYTKGQQFQKKSKEICKQNRQATMKIDSTGWSNLTPAHGDLDEKRKEASAYKENRFKWAGMERMAGGKWRAG